MRLPTSLEQGREHPHRGKEGCRDELTGVPESRPAKPEDGLCYFSKEKAAYSRVASGEARVWRRERSPAEASLQESSTTLGHQKKFIDNLPKSTDTAAKYAVSINKQGLDFESPAIH